MKLHIVSDISLNSQYYIKKQKIKYCKHCNIRTTNSNMDFCYKCTTDLSTEIREFIDWNVKFKMWCKSNFIKLPMIMDIDKDINYYLNITQQRINNTLDNKLFSPIRILKRKNNNDLCFGITLNDNMTITMTDINYQAQDLTEFINEFTTHNRVLKEFEIYLE